MAPTTAPVAGRASRIGTIDPMGRTRIYTDETLKEVAAGSRDAAYVWKRGDLERIRDRRSELGLDKNDEALRVQLASRKVEVATAERRLAALTAQVNALKAELEAATKAEKASSKETAASK